jgi:hypothetical protein
LRAASRGPGLKAGVSAILWEGCKPLPKVFGQTGLKAGCGELLNPVELQQGGDLGQELVHSIGLSTKAFAPAARLFCSSLGDALADIAMIGTFLKPGICRRRRVASSPSTSGITMSTVGAWSD